MQADLLVHETRMRPEALCMFLNAMPNPDPENRGALTEQKEFATLFIVVAVWQLITDYCCGLSLNWKRPLTSWNSTNLCLSFLIWHDFNKKSVTIVYMYTVENSPL